MALYKTNVALVINGDRVEKNTEIELSAKQAAVLDPKDITLVSDIPAPEPEADILAIPLEEMSHVQLKEHAKELGLKVSGSVADLRERITLHQEANAPAPEPEADITSDNA